MFMTESLQVQYDELNIVTNMVYNTWYIQIFLGSNISTYNIILNRRNIILSTKNISKKVTENGESMTLKFHLAKDANKTKKQNG